MKKKIILLLMLLFVFGLCCGCGAESNDSTEEKMVNIAEEFRDAITNLDFTAAKAMYTAKKQETVEEIYMEAGWSHTVANYGDYLGCASISTKADGDYTVVDMVLEFSGGENVTMEVYITSAGEVDGYAYVLNDEIG